MTPIITRREFLKSASAASAGALALPAFVRAQAQTPNSRLNVACVGVGGQGGAARNAVKDENFVAFCDVDDERAAKAYEEFPDVPRFRDYRQMLDKLGDRIDAVTVSTPDHMHYPIAVAALQLGKHVFVEKPLTHTIWEARALAKLAREKKVATQMGNQGHAGEGVRLLKEWVQAGVLGDVREVHSWTDRPGPPRWPQGVHAPDHSKMIPVVPNTLDWDLWLGVAQPRPYDPAYVPFKWRGYWDFGTGAQGDMGCHILDGAFWALDLAEPAGIEAVSANQTDVSGPTSAIITFQFPARRALPPLKLVWYEGSLMPPPPPEWEKDRAMPLNGTLIFGSKATVFADQNYQSVRIIPETKMQEMAPSLPPKTIPRIQGGHFAEWIRACKGGPEAGSNFQIASRLTELCLLSNVAVRARRPLEWDAAAMRVTNLPEANQYITKEYRTGFGV